MKSKKRAMKPIKFIASQVAFAVKIALLYHPTQITQTTDNTVAELEDMASEKVKPSKAVLAYFKLTQSGSYYIWDPAEEHKQFTSWGPLVRVPPAEVFEAGNAIHLAVATVEQGFMDWPKKGFIPIPDRVQSYWAN